MKKGNPRKELLDKLRDGNNVSTACKAVGISRQTFYRWKANDQKFDYETDRAESEGDSFMADFAENKAKEHIQKGDKKMVIYWLNHRNPKFKNAPSQYDVEREAERLSREKLALQMPEAIRFVDMPPKEKRVILLQHAKKLGEIFDKVEIDIEKRKKEEARGRSNTGM